MSIYNIRVILKILFSINRKTMEIDINILININILRYIFDVAQSKIFVT